MELIFAVHLKLQKEIDKASSKKLKSWIQDIWKLKVSACLPCDLQVTSYS